MGAAESGEYLHSLLTRPGRYRFRWLQYDQRHRGPLNQAAVAQVLAQYLWDAGIEEEHDRGLPRRLKDRVSRALAGHRLPPSLLRTFVEAFAMTDADAQHLWDLLLDSTGFPVLVVRERLPPIELPEPARTYQTLALHEFHAVGEDRRPRTHRTIQVIRATGRMTTYRYRFDTSSAVVQVLRGGRASAVHATTAPGVYAVDITLTDPLDTGQTASLEYQTTFAYHAVPEPAFRRVCLRRAENVELHVSFAPSQLPRQVRWCVWAGVTPDSLIHTEPVAVSTEGTVHRYLPALEGAGAGFTWDWA